MEFQHLFQPITINGMELKNRMMVSAMVTQYCDETGMANEPYIRYHEEKAMGGWGLIITENYPVAPQTDAYARIAALWSDEHIPGQKELTRLGHEAEYTMEPASEPKQVIVVGAGVSGCEAAIAAASRGHKVTVYEKADQIGGQWIAAAGVKSVNGLADAAEKLGITVLKIGDASGVKNGMKNIWEGYATGYYLDNRE